MRKKILEDRIMAGFILGVISNIPKLITDTILYNIGFSRFFCWDVTAGVLISKDWIPTINGRIIGSLTDFFAAGVLGVLIVYLLFIFGQERYLFIKGVGLSVAMWLFICIFIVDQRISMYERLFDPWHAYQSFIVHTLWGITVSYLIVKYARSTVVPSAWGKIKEL